MSASPSAEREVTLRFKSAKAKEEFLGQLSDGIGENWVNLAYRDGDSLDTAPTIDVTVYPDGGTGDGTEDEVI